MPNAAGAGPYYLNNLVYANTNFGIQLRGGRFAVIENNTIYQPTGDALRLQDVAAGTLGAFGDRVANNILVAGSGYAMRVDSATLTGLVWDYNDIFVTGTGKFARLDNRDFLTRAAWLAELGFDAHSITTDPQFVDVDGADNTLGYDRCRRSQLLVPLRAAAQRGARESGELRQHERGRRQRGAVRAGAAAQWLGAR